MKKRPSATLLMVFLRGLRLRCPGCGGTRLFRSFFVMRERCPRCGIPFAREPGFYLGSIYLNYGVASVLATLGYPILVLGLEWNRRGVFWTLMVFVILFPIWFFRYARSLWLAMDHYLDPPSGPWGSGRCSDR